MQIVPYEERMLRYKGVLYQCYLIDTLGSIRRIAGHGKHGKLTPCKDSPYTMYRISHNSIPNKQVRIAAHWAVLETFVGQPPVGYVACHIAGANKKDCYLGSCVWGTQKENRKHRRDAATHSTGNQTRPGVLLGLISEILKKFDSGWSVRRLAILFCVSRQAISYRLKQFNRKK